MTYILVQSDVLFICLRMWKNGSYSIGIFGGGIEMGEMGFVWFCGLVI
jgi:hypothetical protein